MIIRAAIALLLLWTAAPGPSNADRLAAMLAGDYSNADQARADSDYYVAFMHARPIWPGRAGGPWLYVEQALEMSPRSPYRQTVLRLVARGDGRVEARAFSLPEPLSFAGAWRDPAGAFAKLEPKKLVEREGCAVVFAPTEGGGFAGAVEGSECRVEARGARYARVEWAVTDADVRVWERFYGAHDEPVAGQKAPYVFARAKAGG